MKIIVVWIWAFWFAMLNYLSKNNKNIVFYAYEKDNFILNNLKNIRENPYFFHWIKLWKNVIFLDNLDSLKEFDLIIVAIQVQFIRNFICEIKNNLKSWVTFLNLSKWIDNKIIKTPSDILNEELKWFDYNYAILSGWMIASEVIEWKVLWAQIWCKNKIILKKLKELFESNKLKISSSNEIKNIELIWSFKNIFALYIWYLEWKWFWMSSIWYYFSKLYKELPVLLKIFKWEENINFSDFSLWWDLIATCFWNSRNRYFWKLVWEWKTTTEAEQILKEEKKHAEGYYTILWIKDIILKNKKLTEFWKIVKIFASSSSDSKK